MADQPRVALPQDLVRAVYDLGIEDGVLELKDRLAHNGATATALLPLVRSPTPGNMHLALQVARAGCV